MTLCHRGYAGNGHWRQPKVIGPFLMLLLREICHLSIEMEVLMGYKAPLLTQGCSCSLTVSCQWAADPFVPHFLRCLQAISEYFPIVAEQRGKLVVYTTVCFWEI